MNTASLPNPVIHPLPPARDKLLFTPGPLTTSLSVKAAMLHDAGSWHPEFNAVVASLRTQLLALAEVSTAAGFEAIPLQGSGTYGVEAVLATALPPDGRLLVLSNGAYGERMALIAQRLRLNHLVHRTPEDLPITPETVDPLLSRHPEVTHVALVHCETTTGILNPLEALSDVVARHQRCFIVDAMSSFGALPIRPASSPIDYLVSSANKCLEGVPGLCFVLARRDRLQATDGWARSLSLDLLDQWRGFERNGQFRYTPPTHAILALTQALRELEDEGGIAARGRRYAANHRTLLQGMAALGFKPLLPPPVQSPIITAFLHPDHAAFRFDEFYRRLGQRGMIIYPGKLTRVNTFRIGTIGRLSPFDIEQLLDVMERVLLEIGCPVPVPPPPA